MADDDLKNGPSDGEALFVSVLSKLRAQRAVVQGIKAQLDEARGDLSDIFRVAKTKEGGGYSRKELTAILDDLDADRRDLQREEDRRQQLREWAGLPVGVQGELWGRLPQESKDEQHCREAGYAAGLRGDPAEPPTEVPERFVQAWLQRWGDGQERLILSMKVADALPKAEASDVGPDDEEFGYGEGQDAPDGHDDVNTEPEQDDPQQGADALRASGFLEPADADEEPEPTLTEVFPGDVAAAEAQKKVDRKRTRAPRNVH